MSGVKDITDNLGYVFAAFTLPFIFLAIVLFAFTGEKQQSTCVEKIHYNPKTGVSSLVKCK